MKIIYSSTITIQYPNDKVNDFVKKLRLPNPEYEKKKRMGLWVGSTSPELFLYEVTSNGYKLPYGLKDELREIVGLDVSNKTDFIENKIKINCKIPLYDYQKIAVEKMFKAGNGILQSKAGSGKTQMGLALAIKYCTKVLWITHTKDLLNQSYERARQYIDKEKLGIIASGKCDVRDITFATIQSLANMDLSTYKYAFGVVIVDECHRVAGSTNKVTQFAKVLNSLAAPHKFGLTATVHRADGLEQCMFAYIGNVKYIVPDEAIADKVLNISVQRYDTDITINDIANCLDTDGTLIYSKFITELAMCSKRNLSIANKIMVARELDRQVLVLSERIVQLKELQAICNDGVVLSGTTKKEDREKILNDMREGRAKILFSSYQLAKEGLDITSLDTLILATPVKDYAIVVQAIGRIARKAEDKKKPVVIDIVDKEIGKAEKMWKKRLLHYKKSGVEIV